MATKGVHTPRPCITSFQEKCKMRTSYMRKLELWEFQWFQSVDTQTYSSLNTNKHKRQAWSAKKEAAFREYAAGKLEPMKGVKRLFDWIDANGVQKAAVTNAPRWAVIIHGFSTSCIGDSLCVRFFLYSWVWQNAVMNWEFMCKSGWCIEAH